MNETWNNLKSLFSKEEPIEYEDLESGESTSMITRVKSDFINSLEVEPSYKTFFIVIAVGLGLLGLSLIFLPFVIFSPQKFLSLFSLGSIVILASFVFIYGTAAYMNMLFEKSRLRYTVPYIASIILGLYFTFVQESFLFSLICVGVQFITLMIFVLTFIPGGNTGIKFILETLKAPLMKIFKNKH
jgi:hypothetical protein